MKIYTRKGDDGRTGLITGERVLKDDARVDLYGVVDELNSHLGAAASFLDGPAFEALRTHLERQQSLLFELGSELAGLQSAEPAIRDEDILELERWMDACEEKLPALRSFILPGGTPAAALLHIARTVCRRLERNMVSCRANVSDVALKYVNRLSDYLFTAARLANYETGTEDVPWRTRRS